MLSEQSEPRYLAIGRVLRPHGIQGELRVEVLTDYPDRLARLSVVYVGAEYIPHRVVGVRFNKGVALLRLEGCEDRNDADALRGQLISVAMDDVIPLEEGEYYHFQLVGVLVESETGELLGNIVEVLSIPGANDVYVVHGMFGEFLVPGTREVVQEIDLSSKRMVIRLLPGLLPDR